jgi:hypothetical protein
MSTFAWDTSISSDQLFSRDANQLFNADMQLEDNAEASDIAEEI